MNKQKSKKISRRDAIKVLAAATGATFLANIPGKWGKPELASGVLPAHAQTSILHTLTCDLNQTVNEPDSDQYTTGVTIAPPTPGIVMAWTMALNNVSLDNVGDATSGTAVTNGVGYASVQTPPVTIIDINQDASVIVTWSFQFPANGTGSCDQAFEYFVPIIP